MHSLLENYLAEVAAHLGPLPAKRRAEELREMRAHLEAAYAAGRERGQAEGEAARDVLAQFGLPGMVGVETITAWRRGVKLDRRSFWSAAASIAVLTLLLTRLTPLIQSCLLPTPSGGLVQSPFSVSLWADWVLWLMPTFLAAGGVSGFLLPRRAVAGVASGLTVCLFSFLAPTLVFVLQASAASRSDGGQTRWLLVCGGTDLVFIVIAAAAAWAGSRWRGCGGRGWGVRAA